MFIGGPSAAARRTHAAAAHALRFDNDYAWIGRVAPRAPSGARSPARAERRAQPRVL